MTPSQQVKLFCKHHQIKVVACRVSQTVTLSKQHPAGAMWIEVFDSYKDSFLFLTMSVNMFADSGKAKPWDKPNFK